MAAPTISSYRRVIIDLDLSGDSQDNDSDMAYLVLATADLLNASTAADTYANPYKEVLYRLRSLAGGYAFRALEALVGARAE
jgi:hypothetical protein